MPLLATKVPASPLCPQRLFPPHSMEHHAVLPKASVMQAAAEAKEGQAKKGTRRTCSNALIAKATQSARRIGSVAKAAEDDTKGTAADPEVEPLPASPAWTWYNHQKTLNNVKTNGTPMGHGRAMGQSHAPLVE